jgi:hypothetical protein
LIGPGLSFGRIWAVFGHSRPDRRSGLTACIVHLLVSRQETSSIRRHGHHRLLANCHLKATLRAPIHRHRHRIW